MLLKGQKMLERLHKLERENGPMNKFISLQREKKEIAGKLSKDEQNKLESALDNVMYLKSKMKKEMALMKVIDITNKEKDTNKKEYVPEGKEKLNYELLKAKD